MDEKQPKYLEIVNWIKEKIEQKELLPGQKMYSENKLCELFSLSRQTVRHALLVLEEEELVTRVRGSGTYVNDSRLCTIENKTRVAVVTTYVDSYIFPKTIQGMENVLFEQGYSVQIAFTNNMVERERTILEDILSRDDVGGIIIEATKSGLPNPNLGLYRELMKRKIPILFVNSYYKELLAPHVTLDDFYVGKTATNYLINMGHRKIAGIFKLDDGQGHLRYGGYIEAIKEAQLIPEENNLVWLDTQDVQELELCMDKILKRLKNCSAVFCYNDQIARNLITLLKQRGIRVPEDLSLISVDDSELASLGEVEFSSVQHPMDKLGAKAAENLIQMMKSSKFDGTYEFQTTISVRNSVNK